MKKYFAEKMSEKGILTKSDAEIVYDAMCEILLEVLKEHGQFRFNGICTIMVKDKKPKKYYDISARQVRVSKGGKKLVIRPSSKLEL
jgi:nucleoid DNA-binding protein